MHAPASLGMPFLCVYYDPYEWSSRANSKKSCLLPEVVVVLLELVLRLLHLVFLLLQQASVVLQRHVVGLDLRLRGRHLSLQLNGLLLQRARTALLLSPEGRNSVRSKHNVSW